MPALAVIFALGSRSDGNITRQRVPASAADIVKPAILLLRYGRIYGKPIEVLGYTAISISLSHFSTELRQSKAEGNQNPSTCGKKRPLEKVNLALTERPWM